MEREILDFLNAGGTRRAVINSLAQTGQVRLDALLEQDLTLDGVPELIVGERHMRIYACRDGRYYTVGTAPTYGGTGPAPLVIRDMNLNGLPEIIVQRPADGSVEVVDEYQIWEWDGERFRNLVFPSEFTSDYMRTSRIEAGWITIYGAGPLPLGSQQWAVRDTDSNGTLEFVATGGIALNMESQFYGPYRVGTTVFMWDGQNFVRHSAEYEPATFRFQAVQDADYFTNLRQYDRALALYRDVIFSDTLDWWSLARQDYEYGQTLANWSASPTPTLAAPDPAERENLSAYARFRIMLLSVVRGRLPDAQAA